MATGHLYRKKAAPHAPRVPPLENGDQLDQKTFHERYEAMPPDVRAELIGGIVFMSSPQKLQHSQSEPRFQRWLDEYAEATPGTEVVSHATTILGPDSELQPDACLLILPENGGQTWEDKENYLHGAPELIGEISWASESVDLNRKKADYEKAGVREYVVVALRQGKVYWFVRRRGKFRELALDKDGIFRSPVFPGLWLDPAALLKNDRKRLLEVLRQGLASPEHAAFAAKLAG